MHRSVHKPVAKPVDKARSRAVTLPIVTFLSACGSDERRLLIIRQGLQDRGSVARRRLGITGRYGGGRSIHAPPQRHMSVSRLMARASWRVPGGCDFSQSLAGYSAAAYRAFAGMP